MVKYDSSKFNDMLQLYQKLSGRAMEDVLNKTGKDIAIQAWKLTPKIRNQWPVRREDSPKRLRKTTKTGKARKTYKGSGASKLEDRLYFALAVKKGYTKARKLAEKTKSGRTKIVYKTDHTKRTVTFRGMRAIAHFFYKPKYANLQGTLTEGAQKIYASRRRGNGYTGAAWGPAIAELGGQISGDLRRFLYHGQSKKGRGSRATKSNKACIIKNTAGGSEEIGYTPMVRAGDIVYADRLVYINRKLREAAAKAQR